MQGSLTLHIRWYIFTVQNRCHVCMLKNGSATPSRACYLPYLSGSCVAFLRESNVTDALVVWVHLEVSTVRDVVEILDILNTATKGHFR